LQVASRDIVHRHDPGNRAARLGARYTAKRATDHFAARDAIGADGSVDAVELWGRRIGRGLSLVGLIVLAAYLYFTYFTKCC